MAGFHFASGRFRPAPPGAKEQIMDLKIDRCLLEAYSRAEISRREIGERMEVEVSDLLAALHAEGLPLPRFPPNPDSPRVKLIKRLAERAARGE
jgi:hypothetical protein